MAEIKNNQDFLKFSFKELLFEFVETDGSNVEGYADSITEIAIEFANQQCKKLNEVLLKELVSLKNDFNHKEGKYKEQLNLLNSFIQNNIVNQPKQSLTNPCVEMVLPPQTKPAQKQFTQKEKAFFEIMELKKKAREIKESPMDWGEYNDIMKDIDNR